MRSSFLPKCQPKIWRISALPSNKLPGQKSFKFLVGILGETMTSKIHSECNWPLLLASWVEGQNLTYIFLSVRVNLKETFQCETPCKNSPSKMISPHFGEYYAAADNFFRALQRLMNVNESVCICSWPFSVNNFQRKGEKV